MEIPNARVLDDGEVRVGIAQADPYRWYVAAMGVFPGLELDFRLTELLNIETTSKLFEGYGNYKDKCMDFKYQIFPESRKFPALAIGMHDIVGDSKLFEAMYLVFSRQIYPFDFTFGIGSDRLKGETSMPLLEDFGPFGGVEIALTERFNFMAEYNPIQYENDTPTGGKRPVPEGADLDLNFGLRCKLFEGIYAGVSYQRGDTFGGYLHIQTKLGAPVLPKRPDHPPLAPVDTRPFKERNAKELVEQLRRAISEKGFYNAKVFTDGTDLRVEFENTRYLSDQKAVGRILRVAYLYAPEDTRKITVVSKRLDLNVLKVAASPGHLAAFFEEEITPEAFSEHLDVEMAALSSEEDMAGYISSHDYTQSDLFLGFKPEVATYLNDPSGFFKFRFSINPFVKYFPWDGGMAYARYMLPIYSNVDTSLPPPEEDTIRMDLVDYLGEDPTFDRLLFDQAIHLTRRTFGRVSVGYFEPMYAGIGGEILTYPWGGMLAFGLEADWARKREPATQLALEDLKVYSVLGNIYYSLPSLGMVFNAKVGQFLAEDRGVRFTVSRQYDTGAIVGAWYSITDTDDLTGVNRGYNDKGVFLAVPIEMFKTRSDPGRWVYAAAPWTRDVAQTVRKDMDIYSLTYGLLPNQFKYGIDQLKK